MAIHAIGYKALGIIDMRGCFPGVVSELNFMAGRTEYGRRGSHHGLIGDAKKGQGDEDADRNKNGRFNRFFPKRFLGGGTALLDHSTSYLADLNKRHDTSS